MVGSYRSSETNKLANIWYRCCLSRNCCRLTGINNYKANRVGGCLKCGLGIISKGYCYSKWVGELKRFICGEDRKIHYGLASNRACHYVIRDSSYADSGVVSTGWYLGDCDTRVDSGGI
jgi:hypothetical protein